MEARNIAIFSAQYPPHMGGIENFTRNLARALATRGHSVVVVTNDTNGLGPGWAVEDGFDLLRLPCLPLVDGRLPLPKPSRERQNFINDLYERHIEGVLINARFYPHSLFGMRYARRKGLTPVVLDHGSAYLSFGSPALDCCARAYERMMTMIGKLHKPVYYGVSRRSAEWLSTFGIESKGVISNAIDASDFRECASGRDFREELGLCQETFLVTFVGRFIPEKGINAIIEASQSAALSSRDVVFALAGDGPLLDKVKGAEGPMLRWVGRLDKSDVSALLQQSQALCLPSRSEGFSTTLLEASSCGCPSITTNVGGAAELIPSSDFGSIVRSASSGELVEAIKALVEHPSRRLIQSGNCKAWVESHYSWETSAESVESALFGLA